MAKGKQEHKIPTKSTMDRGGNNNNSSRSSSNSNSHSNSSSRSSSIIGSNSSNLISKLQLGRELHGDIRWLDGVALVGLEPVGQ